MAKRFPKNVPGPFYVEDEFCLACEAPESEAPDLMDHVANEDVVYHCYFKKQPSTADEVDRAISAMEYCCCGALHYGGNDPEVIQRLQEVGVEHDQIDNL